MFGGRELREFLVPIFRRRGLELLRIPNLGRFLAHRACDLVVDVGANVGDFGREVRAFGYRGRILSIEPIPACFAQLEDAVASDSAWQALNLAVGAEPGVARLNVSRDPRYSSFNSLSGAGRTYEAATAVVETLDVPVRTLDQVLKDDPAQRIFLKIDTQGFEKAVLAGAPATLQRCHGLLIEAPVENLYEGVWGFSEAMAHVEGLGFRLAQILPTNVREKDAVSAVEFDCIFRRADS